MDNSLFVKIPECKSYLTSVEFNFILLEPAFRFEKSVELSSSDERHHEEKSKF